MVTQQDKDDLLELIYRSGGSEILKNISLSDVKIHLYCWDKDRFWNTAESLISDELIVVRGRDYVALTPNGRKKMEEKFNPKPDITHNTLNVGTAVNSPIQQAGSHTSLSQNVTYNELGINDLKKLVEIFEGNIGDLKLDPKNRKKAEAQVATIKAQLSDEPNNVIIQEAGRSLRNITEGAIGSLLASAATSPGLWTAIYTILLSF